MPQDWKQTTLGKVLAPKGYIRGPFGSALRRNELLDSGIPVYEQQHAINGVRDFRFFINEKKFQEMKRFETKPNDLIISCSGTLGKVSIIREEDPKGIISQALLLLRVNADVILPQYLQYFFSSKEGYNAIVSRSSGSVQVNISKRADIEQIPLALPPIYEQKAIVETLGVLDDKIANNTKINHHLEQIAQAIFKSWFVDFEPFGGVMPSDWREGTFSEVISTTLGGDWGKDAPIGNNTQEVYCIRGADIPDVNVGNKGKMPIRFILRKNYASKRLAVGDIVVEISGGSPTQSTGRCALITQSLLERYDRGMVCTNFCRAVKPLEGYSAFVYFYWKYLYDQNVMFSYENGTTGIKNLNITGFLENEPIIIPSVDVVAKFNEAVEIFIDTIFANGLENECLANTRDSLLPRLMSGELSVTDIGDAK